MLAVISIKKNVILIFSSLLSKLPMGSAPHVPIIYPVLYISEKCAVLHSHLPVYIYMLHYGLHLLELPVISSGIPSVNHSIFLCFFKIVIVITLRYIFNPVPTIHFHSGFFFVCLVPFLSTMPCFVHVSLEIYPSQYN